MGGNVSQLPATPPGFPYVCLTFRQWDKIKLLHGSEAEVRMVRSSAQATWPQGIQREANDMGAYELKFGGNPFSKNTSKTEALAIKHFCCHYLAAMRRAGWGICVSTDLSRTTDLTSWFFERGDGAAGNGAGEGLVDRRIFCLSLSSHDKLQLVNAPSYVHSLVRESALAAYGYGVQGETELAGGDYELKLNGYPWYTGSFEEGVYARRALLEIFRRLHAQRFILLTTANLKGTADCLFFTERERTEPDTRYLMLSLNASDRIRLIDAPPDVVDAVRHCISQYWALGLQDQKDFTGELGCYEFKLSGYPWNSSGMEAVSSRLLITTILQSLVAKGWAVCHSLDISRRVNDKAVLVLRSCPPASLPHFCLSPNDLDKLRLINAPPDVIEEAGNVIRTAWPYGIQREGPNAGCYEWKLGGQPWSAYSGNDYAHARHLACLLLRSLAAKGWRLICSADVSAKYVHQQNGPDYPIDVHSWFFAHTSGPAPRQKAPDTGFAPSAFESPPPSYKDSLR